MAINLNNKLNNILKDIDINNKPNLFLHVCCGPCSSAVLYKLANYFNIFLIFANSNIDTYDEFNLRLEQLKKILNYKKYNIKIIYAEYNHNAYLSYVSGLENEPEGGKRCIKCFEQRLTISRDVAIKYIFENKLTNDINYLCTTLSISPHKNSQTIEEIGEKICKDSILSYLPSDFKKENGYLLSINLSKEYGLYRQNYCGCEFSKCI